MVSHPLSPVPHKPELDEKPLSYEEGWALVRGMRGILRESYAKLGGATEHLRKERDSWDADTESA